LHGLAQLQDVALRVETVAVEAPTELPHGIGRVYLAPGSNDQRSDLIQIGHVKRSLAC
jgi:hypothetical protein